MTTSTATSTWIASDPIGGFLTANDGIVYYLTACCKASGKGSANVDSGVVCRKCYAEQPSILGAGWRVDDDAAWARYADALRPHLQQFTDKMVERTRRDAEARA